MKLKSKALLAIILTWGAMLLVVYFYTRKLLENSYIDLENQQAIAHINRVHKAIDQLKEGINSYVTNASIWNDSYQFAIDANRAYIESNFSVPIFLTSNIDIYLVYNIQGNLVYGSALNLKRTEMLEPPNALLDELKLKGKYRKIVEKSQVDTNIMGLMQVADNIVYFAAHSLITSEGKGPSHGTMIMARYIRDEVVKTLQSNTGLNISIYNLHSAMDQVLNKKFSSLQQKEPYLEHDKNTLFIYSFLRDINDHPIAIVKLALARQIYQTGVTAIRYFNTIFILLGIPLTLLLFYLFNRFIISRLEKMNKKIIEMVKTRNFLPIISEEGTDEITSLEKETNKMLNTIHVSNEQKQKLLKEINKEMANIHNIMKKLKSSEDFLKRIIDSMVVELLIVDKKFQIVNLNHHAEQHTGLSAQEAKGKDLFVIYPYLIAYKNKFEVVLKQQTVQMINKIIRIENDKTSYLNVIIYPLIHDEKQYLAIRVDDVTEEIKLGEKLIYNDKFASVGILTAGVAHEINNPLNFLSASVTPLKNDIAGIIELIQIYFSLSTKADLEQKLIEIQQLKDRLNVDLSVKEIRELMAGIRSGADRTAAIVNNLSVFTRSDEEKMEAFDIHIGIDSTLNLLYHKYKDQTKIKKAYNTIPLITCFPGKLNQVFMNIISNAIESIKGEGEIIISTSRIDNKYVQIRIKDNGLGIKEEHLSLIFDPFFTTKPVGGGTGLGLSISATIIRTHQGFIEVNSQVGKGTEFIITLPIEQMDKPV